MDLSAEKQKQNIEKSIEEAIALKKQKKYQAAIAICQKAIALNPNYHKSYHYLGDIFLSSGNLGEAEAAYTTAIALNPRFSWSYHGLSRVFYLQEKWEEAIAKSRAAIQLNPQIKGFYHRLARALKARGSFTEAIEEYQKAIAIEPKFALAHQEMGDIHYQQQNYISALAAYKTALELNHKTPNILANLGSIALAEEAWADAIDYYRQAVELKADPWYYYNLGYALQQQYQTPEAISCYAQALQLDPGFSPAYQKLMFSQLQPAQLDEVVAAFEYNIQQQPNASWLYTRLGDLLSKQGEIPQAIAAYQDATYKLNLWLKPEYTKNYWHRGEVKKPNFIVIGAMKAGTTSLYEYLIQHPQILPCAQKEVHYFLHHLNKGLDWYLAHFPPIVETENYLTGEASPGYLCNTIQSQVKETCPQVKLLAILRNPVDRAISHYYHNVKHGIEMRSFEAAMTAELQAIAALPEIDLVKETKNWSGEQGYLFSGLYVYFLQKWLAVFPREQLLVIQSEDLYRQPQTVMKSVFDFLELPNFSSNKYQKHFAGSYQKLNSQDSKYQLIADLFPEYNQLLQDYLQQAFSF